MARVGLSRLKLSNNFTQAETMVLPFFKFYLNSIGCIYGMFFAEYMAKLEFKSIFQKEEI